MKKIVINEIEYNVYWWNEDSAKREPHIAVASTGEIPQGRQRHLLKLFLKANGVIPHEKANTHKCVELVLNLDNPQAATAAVEVRDRVNSHSLSGTETAKSLQRWQEIVTENRDIIALFGYDFYYIQQLIPECVNGKVKEYYPQNNYTNKDNLPLLYYGSGAFCRFSIDAPSISGVYLWVVESEIIYIGETFDLRQRFNVGYGNISPRNCYVGGQSTNYKMNKVVMEYYKKGKPVNLYFYATPNYKHVELEMLGRIRTKYNVKDNR